MDYQEGYRYSRILKTCKGKREYAQQVELAVVLPQHEGRIGNDA